MFKRSRLIFLKRFVICLTIFGFGCWIYNSILQEKDVDGVVIMGVLMSIVTMAVSAIMGVIWMVWAIITKRTTYKCAYCKAIFETPVFTPMLATEEERFRMIKKMNIKR